LASPSEEVSPVVLPEREPGLSGLGEELPDLNYGINDIDEFYDWSCSDQCMYTLNEDDSVDYSAPEDCIWGTISLESGLEYKGCMLIHSRFPGNSGTRCRRYGPMRCNYWR